MYCQTVSKQVRFLVAAAVTGGKVKCLNTDYHLVEPVIEKLRDANAIVEWDDNSITVDMTGRELQAVNIKTLTSSWFPYRYASPVYYFKCSCKWRWYYY